MVDKWMKYKPIYANPNDYERMRTPTPNYNRAICKVYLKRLNLYTKEEFDQWRKDLEKQFKEAESNFWQKLWGKILYRLVLPKIDELTSPKQIFKVLSKIDKLLPYLAGSPVYLIAILKGIDWVADLVYESMD